MTVGIWGDQKLDQLVGAHKTGGVVNVLDQSPAHPELTKCLDIATESWVNYDYSIFSALTMMYSLMKYFLGGAGYKVLHAKLPIISGDS